jgi:hypothetical protein
MTREDCPGCNSVPGRWICLFHGIPLVSNGWCEDAINRLLATPATKVEFQKR